MTSKLVPLVALLTAAACSGPAPSTSQRALTGRLDPKQVRLVGARVVAQARSGKVFFAPVTDTGEFRIVLPVGEQYVLRFANVTGAASRYDSFAVLSPRAGRRAFSLTPGAEIDLGLVGRATSARGLGAMSAGEDDDASSSEPADDDSESGDEEACAEQDDELEVCDVSGGADELEVESEHDLLAEVDCDHDGVADAEDAEDDRETCSSAVGSDDCELDDDHEHELEAEHESTCQASSGGASSTVTPEPGVMP